MRKTTHIKGNEKSCFRVKKEMERKEWEITSVAYKITKK